MHNLCALFNDKANLVSSALGFNVLEAFLCPGIMGQNWDLGISLFFQ